MGEATGRPGQGQQVPVGVGPNRFWLPVTPAYGVWCEQSDHPIVLFYGLSFDILSKEERGLYMVQCMNLNLDFNVITPFVHEVCGLIPGM